ncbi:MAG: UvrD-helicase domain-containing protein [Bacteroidota bacterium]
MKNIEFINAGAGSGKTFFLSRKLSEVVSSHPNNDQCSAEEIILTTFTDIAAAELKSKAHEVLLKAGNTKQANLLSSAAIGTVHSVALQLIQKYWYFLGEGVKLQVMPEKDKNFFLNQSLAFIPTADELNKLESLTQFFDFQKGIYEKDPDHWKNDLLDIIGKALNNRMESLAESRTSSLEEIDRLFPLNPDWTMAMDEVSVLLNSILRLLQASKPNATNSKRIDKAESLLNLNGNFGVSNLFSLQSLLSDLPGYIKNNFSIIDDILQKLSNVTSSPMFVQGIKEYVCLIFDLAIRSIERYRNYKQEHTLIDYNDMEVLFLKLLENPQAQNEIRNRYKIVLVDEFQDCSPIQIEIFCKLSELVKQSYWVGDPKQAIYDFRGTDPLLVEAIINKLNTQNADNLKIGERLSDSWRSRPQIVDLTNHIFSSTLADQVDPGTIELNAVRTSNEFPDDALHKPIKKWEIHDEKSNITSMVHHIASEIANLIHRNDVMVVDKTKSKLDKDPVLQEITKRPLKAGDITVLCRTNTRVSDLAASLKKFGLQVAAEQKSLTETAEMKLVLALLNYYLDKNDTLAKATIRFLSEAQMDTSGLIDERLNFLYGPDAAERPDNQEDGNTALWETYFQYLNFWSNENPILQKIEKIRGQSEHLSVGNLVNKLITVSAIGDIVILWDNPLQRMNNLQACRKMATDYENSCLVMNLASSLRGFIESVNYYGNQEISQGAAAGVDAVNVMTYHKSKGLEWPVVILTQLDYDHLSEQNQYAKGYFGVNLYGVGEIDLDNPHKGKRIILIPWPFGGLNSKAPAELKNKIQQEERFQKQEENTLRELKRLLYVGMTRARDMMIHISYNKQEFTWVNHLLGFQQNDSNKDLNFLGTTDEILVEEFNYEQNIDYPRPEIKPVSVLLKNGPVAQDNPKFRNPSKSVAVEGIQIEIVRNFNYRIQRNSGLDLEDNIVGDCLHNLFYSFIPGAREGFLTKSEKVIANFGLCGDLTHPEHIYNAAQNLFDYLSGAYGKPVQIYKEIPLQMVEEGIVYNGNADLVWETQDGLILVDYKSYSGKVDNIINPKHSKYAGIYSGQLSTYIKMLEAGHPGRKKVKDALIYYVVMGVVVRFDF